MSDGLKEEELVARALALFKGSVDNESPSGNHLAISLSRDIPDMSHENQEQDGTES